MCLIHVSAVKIVDPFDIRERNLSGKGKFIGPTTPRKCLKTSRLRRD